MKQTAAIIMIMVMILAGCDSGREEGVVKQDTLSPYAPHRDSGLQPVDSSHYHTDTSTQHHY